MQLLIKLFYLIVNSSIDSSFNSEFFFIMFTTKVYFSMAHTPSSKYRHLTVVRFQPSIVYFSMKTLTELLYHPNQVHYI